MWRRRVMYVGEHEGQREMYNERSNGAEDFDDTEDTDESKVIVERWDEWRDVRYEY